MAHVTLYPPRVLLAALLSVTAQAQTIPAAKAANGDVRTRLEINDGWKYRAGGLNLAERPAMPDDDWERVKLPHTWNVTDPFDDAPSYNRGIGWYRRRIELDETLRGKRLYLHFEGVNQVADVFMNGAFVGQHKGGYSAFTIDITDEVKFGGGANENVIAVKVDNSHNPFIAPLSVGYALYGGIYRDVWLVATDPVHITMSDHGSSGVYLSTPAVSAASGSVRARGAVVNESTSARALRIVNTLLDARGTRVVEQSSAVTAGATSEARWEQMLPLVRNPHLWSPDDPYLYTIRTDVYDGSTLRDRVENSIGFRWFAFDAQTGFSLNGKKLRLRGTNRHQDFDGHGSALSNEIHVRDLESIKDMGANFLRLAHYPQDPAVLDAADRLGLLIWEEIPVVNYITVSPEFTNNSAMMLREMIRQHFNHPSVIMWGIMNEVFLWSPQGFRIRKQLDTTYMSRTRDYARHLDSVVRAEDPTRVTTMAVHGSGDYDASGVAKVSQVVGQNIYSGWYSGVFADLGKQLDRRHAAHPAEVIFVSEYGAEDDYRVESLDPERFDFSGTWMRRFHESYLRQFNARPWLGGTAIWSQFDFSQPETGGSIPYMNQKGMARWNRIRKDVFYLYKANWNPAPMAYIASRGWTRRTGTNPGAAAGAGATTVTQPVDVYSNLPRVEFLANGRSLGVKAPDDVRRITWEVPFANGKNKLEVRGVGDRNRIEDTLTVEFTYRPPRLADPSVPFRELGVNTGGRTQYAEPGGPLWEGDREYTAGGFGYVGGESKIFDKDLAIRASDDTPLYFSYLLGLDSYRMDVPDGQYDVELMFAEPDAKPGDRIFGVTINGKQIAESLDLSKEHGIAKAVVIRSSVTATGGTGVDVRLSPIKGKPILNAIYVRKR